MGNDINKGTKNVIALVLVLTMFLLGYYLIAVAPENGQLWGLPFNTLMGGAFILYGLFRGVMLYNAYKNTNDE